MKNKTINWQSAIAMIGFLAVGTAAFAQGKTTQRDIADFVSTQGTFCIDDGNGGCFLFVPPIYNFLGWTDLNANLCISADYAGLADEWIMDESGGTVSFGTTFKGSISERPLADGRAEVTVRLNTENALVWVITGCNDFATDPLVFGNRAPDVLTGGEPALGESFLQVKFINPAPGDPLPDLFQLFLAPEDGQEGPSYISFNARARGTLREAFGVPDGTPGRAETIQTGLFMTKGKGATADAFPAERVRLNVVGR